jgi:putative tryptophan/tyrosine transport system substrate-binding protein
MMDRRRFLLTSLAGVLAGPLAAGAQPQAQVSRIGVIPSGSPAMSAASLDAFRQRLRELGYVEGRNIAIEIRYAVAHPERFRGLAAELVGLGVHVIVASSTLATRAARDETSTIPIVMVTVGDAVGAGLVRACPDRAATSRDTRSWGPSWLSKASTCSRKPSREPRASRCSSTRRSRRTL